MPQYTEAGPAQNHDIGTGYGQQLDVPENLPTWPGYNAESSVKWTQRTDSIILGVIILGLHAPVLL
jgi:hypothetical protein